MKYAKLLVLFISVSLSVSACGGSNPAGPGPTPSISPSPTSPPVYLKINYALPNSDSTVCTGRGVGNALQVGVGFNLPAAYPPKATWFIAVLYKDGQPVPWSGAIGNTSRADGEFVLTWTPGRTVTSSDKVVVTYEYRPNGLEVNPATGLAVPTPGMIVVGQEAKDWALVFNSGC